MNRTPFFLLLASVLIGCNPFSLDPPSSNSRCQRFVSGATTLDFVIIRDREVGYRLPRFLAGSNDEIAFVKTDVSAHQILKLHLGSQQEEVLLETAQGIQAFDLNPAGEIVLVSDGEVHIQLSPSSGMQAIPFPGQARRVLWQGDHLLVMTEDWNAVHIDLNGQVLASISPPQIVEDGRSIYQYANWALKDSSLLFGRYAKSTGKMMIYQYRVPAFQVLDSLDGSEYDNLAYGNLEENSFSLSANDLDIAYVASDLAFLSRKSRLYRMNVATKAVNMIWERSNCQVLESGISLSADQKQLVMGAVQILDDPQQRSDGEGYAEFGLLFMDINGQNEEVFFP